MSMTIPYLESNTYRCWLHSADINVGIGVSIYSTEQSDYGDLTLLWVYLAFAVLTVLLSAILFIAFTGEAWVLRADGELTTRARLPYARDVYNSTSLCCDTHLLPHTQQPRALPRLL